MSVKKIFMTLIVIVMCVVLGAFLINVLLPNVAIQVVDATEDSIANATGMTFDFNGNGNTGATGAVTSTQTTGTTGGDTDLGAADDRVQGFTK